ncbi:MAG: hypothetical protein COV72_02805 [Candidatus Omnitrophica bacterium CG11_big_fil_rev_8_21_14_0_20_42_13]|uniref:Carrier domain-containing protein n=1 Tax=Candidatus Ghiorseimicrobium undicola TaxID=1974746 RepID=A0A2H0LYK6_9BACT|nr:MAG: hypothetical protein COV72_02805 [Candidatus Omnitrophica bacterium CG11_big_fil_rev_8_21_14_0_20_42_13]
MLTRSQNIFSEFSAIANSHPEKKAIFYKPEKEKGYNSLTYAQIYDSALKLGNILSGLGIIRNDKIAILLDNQPEYAIAFMAAMSISATAVPLDIQFSNAQIKQLILHSEARILITTKNNHPNIGLQLRNMQTIIIDSEEFHEEFDNYSADNKIAGNLKYDNELALLFYTSGTTDMPKAVMLTHKNLLSNINSIQESKIINKNDVIVSVLPLHHAYPFTVTLLTPLLTGAKIIYPKSRSSSDMLEAMRKNCATILVGVPQIYSLMQHSINEKIRRLPALKKGLIYLASRASLKIQRLLNINTAKYLFKQIHSAFGPHLRFLVSGGARLDPDIANDFVKWGFTIIEGYGLTETSPVATFNPVKKPKIGSVGVPISSVEIKIIEKDKNGVGEIAIKGPNVMTGYYNMPRQTKDAIKDGWFASGDLGYMDSDGYLYITGRKKEIIVLSNGKNINPEEIEKHYLKSPFIKELCVLAVKSNAFLKGTEHLGAIIVADEEYFKSKNETNIRSKLKWELESIAQTIPAYKRIKEFVVSKNALPRTRLGKITRHRIMQLYAELLKTSKPKEEEYLKQDEINILYSDTAKNAINFLEKTLNRKININDHLELDLGLDSLGRIEVLLSLQGALNLQVSDETAMEFFMCNTVKELLLKLKSVMPQISDEQFKEEGAIMWDKIVKESPSAQTLDKLNIKPGKLNIALNLLLIPLIKIFFRVFFLLKTEGQDNLPKKGPYIICPNHTNYLDGLFVLSALPFNIVLNTYFVGYSIIFEHFLLRKLIRIARLIPLEISLNLIESLRSCAFVLQNSKNVCYFPEGLRSIDGKVKEFKKGVGILVKELNVPAIPVYIDGAFRSWPRTRKLPRPAKITVKFGKIMDNKTLNPENKEKEEAYILIAENLRRQVAKTGKEELPQETSQQ